MASAYASAAAPPAAASSSSSVKTSAAAATATEFGPADYVLKVVVIGDSGVGKSCLLKRFSSGHYLSDFYSTIGVDLEIRTIDLNGKVVKLQVWDTAGQERFRTIATSYFRGAHAIMLTYDVTCGSSFASIPGWLREVSKYATEDAKILLCGNKCDLSAHRIVSTAEGAKLAADLGVRFIETSAKTATNVDAAFIAMAQDYVDSKFAAIKHSGPNGSVKGGAKGSGSGSGSGNDVGTLNGESLADGNNGCVTTPLTCPTCTIL